MRSLPLQPLALRVVLLSVLAPLQDDIVEALEDDPVAGGLRRAQRQRRLHRQRATLALLFLLLGTISAAVLPCSIGIGVLPIAARWFL